MFVHLHCHSHYSFLRGVASPEEIVAAAVEQKMPAVALTDTNGLYAAVQSPCWHKKLPQHDVRHAGGPARRV
jgi:DNA polymerase III alpha subunit